MFVIKLTKITFIDIFQIVNIIGKHFDLWTFLFQSPFTEAL